MAENLDALIDGLRAGTSALPRLDGMEAGVWHEIERRRNLRRRMSGRIQSHCAIAVMALLIGATMGFVHIASPVKARHASFAMMLTELPPSTLIE